VNCKIFTELVHTSRLHTLKKQLTLAMVNVMVAELHALGRILGRLTGKNRPPLVVLSMDIVTAKEVSPYWNAIANIAKHNN